MSQVVILPGKLLPGLGCPVEPTCIRLYIHPFCRDFIPSASGHPLLLTSKSHSMNKKGVQVLIHILAWLVFLSFPFVFFPRANSFLPSGEIVNFILAILPGSIAGIAFFYFNYYFAIPRFYLKKKYRTYSLIISWLLCICSIDWLAKQLVWTVLSTHECPCTPIRKR